jgi:alkylation response protein AidB-like acyl-CoA dehydrogenase
VDVNLTEQQMMLQESASEFLAKECPKTKVRELEEGGDGHSPQILDKMAGLGWTGLIIAEEYEGMGMTFQDLTVLLEAMGANILPGPFFCTMIEGAMPVMTAGSEEQKAEFLPKIAGGGMILTMALLEGECNYRASQVAAAATRSEDRFLLNGTKLFVEQARVADYLICAARTEGRVATEDGITLFLVDSGSPGIEGEVMPTMGRDWLCEVRFNDVSVPEGNVLGGLGEGWRIVEDVIRQGTIAKCAESIGGMQACLDMTVGYAKERVQYGRPIGSFQALQHVMADMWILTQTSRYLTYLAAWKESEGLPCIQEASTAKAYVNEAYKWVSSKAVQLHGGIGTSREHDIGLYYRRAKAADIAFGNTDFHRERVAGGVGLLS